MSARCMGARTSCSGDADSIKNWCELNSNKLVNRDNRYARSTNTNLAIASICLSGVSLTRYDRLDATIHDSIASPKRWLGLAARAFDWS